MSGFLSSVNFYETDLLLFLRWAPSSCADFGGRTHQTRQLEGKIRRSLAIKRIICTSFTHGPSFNLQFLLQPALSERNEFYFGLKRFFEIDVEVSV